MTLLLLIVDQELINTHNNFVNIFKMMYYKYPMKTSSYLRNKYEVLQEQINKMLHCVSIDR